MRHFGQGRPIRPHRDDQQPVDLAMHLHGETEKAFKLSDTGNEGHAQWVPKSQVEHDEDSDIFTMPQWMAKQRGWI